MEGDGIGPAEAPTTEQMIEDVRKEVPDSAPPAPVEEKAPEWDGSSWAFETQGKKVVPDSRDKLMTWASQGYNYSQRMNQFNRQQSEWQAKLAAAEAERAKLAQYAQIDEYAAKNPEWWKHVTEQYGKREAFNLPPEVAPLVERLEQTEGILKQWQEAQQAERMSQADQWLDGEINDFKKSYPQLDLGSVDESGKSLELRILEHANDIGATSFRAAARDYLHDKLIEHAKAEARMSVAKSTEQARAKGILGVSPAPTKGGEGPVDPRGKSWGQLAQMAIASLG